VEEGEQRTDFGVKKYRGYPVVREMWEEITVVGVSGR